MRNRILRTLATLLSLSLTLASCQNDEEGQAELLPEKNKLQVMAVFAPGQLGDNGYADNVLYGVLHLIQYNDTATTNSVDADFISRYDFASTRQAVEDWLANPVSPVNGKTYTRRLLVLTEPFLADWLNTCKDLLRPTDEVLVLKAIQEDVDKANSTLDLGNRLHAINISMSEAIRMFCETVLWYIEDEDEDEDEDNPIHIQYSNFPVFRLYSEDLRTSRDSVYETIEEEMGKDILFTRTEFQVKGPDGYPVPLFEFSTLEQRLSYMLMAFNQMWRNGMFFPIFDLGATNSAIDYFILNHADQLFQPLLLDAGPSVVDRLYILRPFDRLLANWIWRWMQAEAGTMPVAEVHGHWDGYPCQTNMWFNDVEDEDVNDEEDEKDED